MQTERIEDTHSFWLTTCGIDTHRRGPKYARQDTPWNAFTQNRQALVNTLWADCIVEIEDPKERRKRRFVKLGAHMRTWKTQAIPHGKEARANLLEAIEARQPIFGFEAEPVKSELEKGKRVIKHFYVDRAHQLIPIIGLSREDLNDQLNIEAEFRRLNFEDEKDATQPAFLFELVEPRDEIPGSLKNLSPPENEPHRPLDVLTETDDDGSTDDSEDNRTNEEYAVSTIALLIAHVSQQEDEILIPIRYGELATMLGRHDRHGAPLARGIGPILDRASYIIDEAGAELGIQVPFLASVVVSSTGENAGLPNNGVKRRWPGYEMWTREEKQVKVFAEYQRIMRFGSTWDDVLRLVNQGRISETAPPDLPLGRGGWGGGESECHKALKRFVLLNPQLFGVEAYREAKEEFDLRSADTIDVLFKSDAEWVGIEVKSRTSDQFEGDYERGLYQVIKYQALLEAEARIDHPTQPPKVRVLLVLETKLPSQYKPLAALLNIEILEGITPPDSAAEH